MVPTKTTVKKFFFFTLSLFIFYPVIAQQADWQQRVEYEMDIHFNVKTNQFKGYQDLVYYNNSPETLDKVYFHLYYNAFQPGSMMDIRSRTIEDPDRRVADRIQGLEEDEIGYHKIHDLTQNGEKVEYAVDGTILEVKLAEPVKPGKKAEFRMEFTSQVPLQIRRTGRDNKEGVRYSMTQWYPKMVEYDQEGWHTNPYIGREFHGVWGDFEVTIHIDSTYVLGGTGILQNKQEVGHGYEDPGKPLKRPDDKELTWRFVAENVHDFAWAADPDYKHVVTTPENGPELHFLYQPDSTTKTWEALPEYTAKIFEIMNENFGEYPYRKYSVIQGGDGGMEYPMATLITGERSLKSLVGVTTHEVIHSWYQMVLATNEAKYPWMDEGFTSYATSFVFNKLFGEEREYPFRGSYHSYYSIVQDNMEEPMSTHADHFITNRAYGVSSYSKGAVFLNQLSYIIGKENFMKGMKNYFYEWKFKHPTPSDFKRVMEKTSGIQLDWYMEQWIETTNTIDYAVDAVYGEGGKTKITLERKGTMPMPLDVMVTFTNGDKKLYYIPLRIMRGEKPEESKEVDREILKDWPWTYPYYSFSINREFEEIEKVEIDPSLRMADVENGNNVFPKDIGDKTYEGN